MRVSDRTRQNSVIIAALYPVFLWFLVFRFRRTWAGLAIVVAGTLMVWPVARIAAYLSGSLVGGVMANLVYGEMALIALVSLWLVSMRLPPIHPVCPYCRYDLRGLPVNDPGAVCPECGNVLNPRQSDPTIPFCLCCGRKLPNLDPSITGQTCPGCGANESDFANWTRARAVRDRAALERSANQGRSAR